MGFFGGGGASVDLASPSAIGSTTPNTGAFTTLSANNGTITTSSPAFTLAQTWNAAGTTFTALRVNVTNTNSAAGSLLLDLQLGGSTKFNIRKDGRIFGDADSAMTMSGGFFTFYSYGVDTATFGATAFRLGKTGSYTARLDLANSGGGEVTLTSDAASIFAQRSGTTAQTFRLYNTFTSATNFERVNFRWASNEFILDAEKGSAGGTLRGVKIGSATTSLLSFYGVTPVDQPATVTDPTGGGTQDAEARTAINAIIDRLQELGLIA